MNPDPGLPESSDPHRLLGVSPAATEEELKRAYVERIKVFRPDRAPAEFQRIRAAYEQALQRLQWATDFDSDSDSSADEEGVPLDAFAPRPRTPVPKAETRPLPPTWALVREGRIEDAERSLDAVPGRDPWAHAQRFLLDEMLERPFAEAASHLAAAIDAGIDLEDWVMAVLSVHERRSLARDARLSIPRLLRHPSLLRSGSLIYSRRDALLMDGEIPKLLDELSSEIFTRAASDTPWLRYLALGAAVAACLRDPWGSDHLYDLYATEPVTEGSLEEIFLIRRSLRSEWDHWEATAERVPELVRVLELQPVLDAAEILEFGLSAAVEKHSEECFAALSKLARSHDHLRALFLETLAPDAPPPASDETLHALKLFVYRADDELESNGVNSTLSYLAGALLIGTVITFVRHGWWGLLPLGLLLLGFGLWWLLDPYLYRRVVRPAALRAIRHFRCHPADLLAAIRCHGKGKDYIGRFEGEIGDDVALHLFALALSHDERLREEIDAEDVLTDRWTE